MRRAAAIVGTWALVALMVAPLAAQALPIKGRFVGMAGKRSVVAGAQIEKPSGPHSNIECIVESEGQANLNLDCDEPLPNNEPDIEVNPTDPLHMVVSSNDFGTCCDQFYTTFDGGETWTTGNMSHRGNNRIGSDPVSTFDVRTGNVLHSSLNFTVTHNFSQACDGDVVVSVSGDGGLHWDKPVIVDDGIGCDLSKLQLFNDKEWMVTDNDPDSPFYGRTYLTWTKFESRSGAYQSSAIWEAHSDDGGRTWSESHEISGSNPSICTFQESGPAGECDENQFSVPTVTPDGTVHVAFENEQNEALWETDEVFDDQYLVVSSDDGGETWSAPSFVVGLEDGSDDYPLNVDGRQTLTGYQVRVNSAGNIVADPNTGQLYLVFSDNRNGTSDSADPVTNTDVFMMTSTDGTTWTGPAEVDAGATDQWFPWVEVNPVDGTVGVLYHDRLAADPDLYDTTLAEGSPGSFTQTTVTTTPSNPVESLFFQAGVEGCEMCATFHGDYNNISYGSDGNANLVWTDMRDFVAEGPFGTGFAQFIYYARM